MNFTGLGYKNYIAENPIIPNSCATPAAPSNSTPVVCSVPIQSCTSPSQDIYNDTLVNGWLNYGWGTSDFSSTQVFCISNNNDNIYPSLSVY